VLVILDTNIFLSGLISPFGPPALILDAWREKRFDLVTCTQQIEEIRTASRYLKLRQLLQPHRVGILVNRLHAAHIWTEALPAKHEAADSTDSFLLNLTEAAQAHYLVTGDKRAQILQRKKVGIASILTASSFCQEVLKL
jgi:hypothetical protein